MQTAEEWVDWLESYGAEKFYAAFMKNAQDAKSRCIFCHRPIYLDIQEGGGIPDWRTYGGDYGCVDSPETDDDGLGSHLPRMLSDDNESQDET
jgi:hypothetical protein